MFPDGSNEGLDHTADATLWFFHAVDRYHRATGDDAMLARLLPVMTDIAERHLRGTRFGIGVDPADGLLRQGVEGFQLTWMDAKCDDWVVTPRRGKAVEINALWYNALCLLSAWMAYLGATGAEVWAGHAARARESFNRRFGYEQAWADGGRTRTMTLSDLITTIAFRFPNLTAKDAEITVKEILDAIVSAMFQGDGVEIRGFGSNRDLHGHHARQETGGARRAEKALAIAVKGKQV